MSAALPPLAIRAMEPSDALAIAALMNQPGVYEGTLQLPYGSVTQRVERLQAADRTGLALVALEGEHVVGAASLGAVGPSLRQAHARWLGIAVAADRQGRGIGGRLMTELLRWADGWAQVLRIELRVYVDNAAAIALYRRFGFEQEGVLRAESLRDGRYVDTLLMARLHPAQPRLPAAGAA